jgi:hypothetical protein
VFSFPPSGDQGGQPLTYFLFLSSYYLFFSPIEGTKFHELVSRKARKGAKPLMFISPFGGLRGLPLSYSLFLLSYYLFKTVLETDIAD